MASLIISFLLLSVLVAIATLTPSISILFNKNNETNRKISPKIIYILATVVITTIAGSYAVYFKIGTLDQAKQLLVENENKERGTSQTFDPVTHIKLLEQELTRKPYDPILLKQLSRIYMLIGDYPKSVATSKMLVEVEPTADNFVKLADSISMTSGGEISEEVSNLLRKALSIDEKHPVALTLLGIEYAQRGENSLAVENWQKADKFLPIGSNLKPRLKELIEQATPDKPKARKHTTKIRIKLSIDSKLKEQVALLNENAKLFVMIKGNVPGPPLLVTRLNKVNFPTEVVLDESMKMVPDAPLDKDSEVFATARISKNGEPIASSGDLEGKSKIFRIGTLDTIKITIKNVIAN